MYTLRFRHSKIKLILPFGLLLHIFQRLMFRDKITKRPNILKDNVDLIIWDITSHI